MIAGAAALEERPEHATDEALEGYVMDLLDQRALRALEEHVSTCLPCARRLATEARREMALAAAMAALPRTAKVTRIRKIGPRRHHGAVLAAAAAALALVSGLGQQRSGLSPFREGAADLSPAALASGEEVRPRPLLACLLDGEEALCAARSQTDQPRSIERSSRWHSPGGDVSGEICRAASGTCARQSRPQ